MTTQEVANRLVEMCRSGQILDAQKELYAENVISLEPQTSQMPSAEGLENVIAKGKSFADMIEEHHGANISDPIVAGNHFTIGWNMDVTMKGQGRTSMDEVCVYKVEDGKITAEQFFY